MSQTKFEYYYWDSSVFLAYLNNEPERATIIEQLIELITKNRDLLTNI